tara:strand:+ start:2656 stop:3075 length:420 start_codon:yes stop_codon:yes gene_type:complete
LYGINVIGGLRGFSETDAEHFAAGDLSPADIHYKMGDYSGISLGLNEKVHYDKMYHSFVSEEDKQLRPGSAQDYESCSRNTKPRVDNSEDSPCALATLKYNKVSYKCCPGIYSSSSGCVCMTENQSKFLSTRGGNKSPP